MAALPSHLLISEARALKALLLGLLVEPHLTLDASGVTSVDAAGVQLLLAAALEARARGGRLSLRAPSSALRGALTLSGLLTELCPEEAS